MEMREIREIKLALLFEKKYLFAINKDRFTGKANYNSSDGIPSDGGITKPSNKASIFAAYAAVSSK
jgi:hypothetical protein